MNLLAAPLEVGSVGARLFDEALVQNQVRVHNLSWEPPLEGTDVAIERLALRARKVAEANTETIRRMNGVSPLVTGIARAGDVMEGLDERTFLHAGPPLGWAEMCGPLQGALCGAAVYEGIAADPEEAGRMARAGEFRFSPCHDHAAVGPMAGVVSASMPVWMIEDAAGRATSFCTLNEGLGRVLRYGANGPDVIDRLHWIQQVLAPVLNTALRSLDDPLDLRSMIAQALQMGDEGHNRNRGGTSLLIRHLLPALLESPHETSDVVEVARFIDGNDHFFLNLTMPAAKLIADAGRDVEYSSVVVAMARNGSEFGLRVSGLGDRWFTGPAGRVEGLYFPGFGEDDANLDIGDSTITETVGLGAFAMASAPAIVRFVGGDAADAVNVSNSMYDLCVAESESFLLPALGFRGAPFGIDIREVARTGVLPAINTGIAHRDAGVGQIGAGFVSPPKEAFVSAVRALAAVD